MRSITHKQMSSELNNKFWFNWDAQKQCVYKIALDLYMIGGQDPSSCIKSAHDFVETFRSEVMDQETKLYYNKG